MKAHISDRLNIKVNKVASVLELLNGGATIPFIARYRKEATGSLDEVALEKIDNERKKFIELAKRKEVIFTRLDELGNSDDKLRQKINDCFDTKELEDIYLPFKPKRVTRAAKAIALGLEPLAKIIMSQRQNDIIGQSYRFAKNGLSSDEALAGARDIIAEWINENSYARNQVRREFQYSAQLISKVAKGKEQEAIKYRDYFEFQQLAKRIPSHRYLAITRAEKEGLLKVKVKIDTDKAIEKLERIFVKGRGESAEQIQLAIKDSLKRLLQPSLETEFHKEAKEKADEEAIGIFSKNLSQLLLAPPLGAKKIMALDPGFRTGCKLVCLDIQTNIIEHCAIYPHPPINKVDDAKNKVLQLIKKHDIEAIAIGNGTAGRETEQFVKDILPKDASIEVYSVNESGASIYSASETGRKEFPNLDVTVRGAISIGRRLIDPLAELVKIDPKSIGVGQYQHDVAQDKLKSSLDNTVSFSVNKVGVNLNTASKHLLQYVSGIGPKLADNIVKHRSLNGPFNSRAELNEVSGLGKKAFEQSAGFLRIKNGLQPLDDSGVHPESYHILQTMARRNNCEVEALLGNEILIKSIKPEEYVSENVGLPTLIDILKEIRKPGIDPRGEAKSMEFDSTIKEIKDIRIGMKLPGKVTNLTKFGAFVDIGVKENGLIHKSQMADRYVEDPSEVLRLDQEVLVKVLDVDLVRKRIQLTLKNLV